MNGPALFSNNLLTRLPSVKGKLTRNASLKDNSWLCVGGPAEVLFKPQDINDLANFLKDCPHDIPLTVLGVASNTLIRDGGVAGVVIKLPPSFASIKVEGEKITAGTAALDLNIARAAQKAGIAGFEFLCGIPGTLGGALRMNAGAHGGEIKDIVTSITALDRKGQRHILSNGDMGFTYRKSATPADFIFVEATLQGHAGIPEAIDARIKAIQQARSEAQPIREKTGGSTFANPNGYKAWELIDKAGCRGLCLGDAMMSQQHCNFMINKGKATAAELEALGEEVRRRVKATTGVDLLWEICRIGVPIEERVKK